jgi:AraC-like DNA-binding protein
MAAREEGFVSQAAILQLCAPAELPGVTLFRADRIRQKFSRHAHEEYALGVITGGVLGFDYRGESLLAGRGEVNLVVPGEAHTGHPALGEDWSYRMFYIQPAVLREVAGSLPFFKSGVIQDRALAASVLSLHNDLTACGVQPLETQSRWIALLAQWIRTHGEKRQAAERMARHTPNVERVREFLDDCWDRKPALNELAQLAGIDAYQLIRAFTRRYGLPPHAYLIQCQVREAKRLLDEGTPLVDVAAAACFADQSHLNRHFKRIWGLTPGHYRNFVQDSRTARR